MFHSFFRRLNCEQGVRVSKMRSEKSFQQWPLEQLAMGVFVCLFSMFIGCKGSSTVDNTKQISNKVEQDKPQLAVPAKPLNVRDSQRILLFMLPEAPCTMSGVSGTSLSPFRIVFVGAELPHTQVGSKVVSGIRMEPFVEAPRCSSSDELCRVVSGVRMEPFVKGYWEWTNANELSFKPTSDWIEKNYRVTLSDSLVPRNFALTTNELRFSPRGSCVNTSLVHLPYRITAPKLPTKPTDTLPDQLLISFDRSVAPQEMIQKSFTEGATLEPTLPGDFRWISDRALVFIPSEPWQAGTNYLLRFSPEVFAQNTVIPGYEYRFSTPQSDIERARSSYTFQNPGTPSREKEPKPAPLTISFSAPVVASELVDKPLHEGISIVPGIKGEWRWTSAKVIVLMPEEHWELDTTYTVKFSSRVFGDTKEEKWYQNSFATPRFETPITKSELYIEPKNPQVKRVVSTIALNYPVEKSEFEKHISLTLEPRAQKQFPDGTREKNYNFKVSYDEFGREAYIHSEPVPVPEIDAQMRIRIAAGIHSSLKISQTSRSTEALVYVPSIANYFRIESIAVANVPNKHREIDQVLVISTTAGVDINAAKSKIQVKLLPEKNENAPEKKQGSTKKAYRWDNLAEITPAVLSHSQDVSLEPIAAEEDFTKQLSFQFDADVGRSLLVTLGSNLQSVDEYRLAKEFQQIVFVGALPKTVQILSDGSLLSLTGEKKLSVMMRGVHEVEIEVSRLLPQTINQLVVHSGGTLQKSWWSNYAFNADDLSERFVEKRAFPKLSPGQVNYTAVDFTNLLNTKTKIPRGLFVLNIHEVKDKNKETVSRQEQERNNGSDLEEYDNEAEGEVAYPGDDNSYNSQYSREKIAQDRRLILITDLGLLVKNNQDGSHDIFVQSLRDAAPAAGAVVQVLGRNGLPLFTKTTGPDGHVVFPKLDDFIREKEPTVYTVEKNGDFSFLPFKRDDRRLNFSRFDVGGLATQKDAPGIQAFLFSDRGVYRPGEDMHFGAIIKADDWKQDISGVPLEVVFTDPRGLEIRKDKLRFGKDGFEELAYQTQESSPTGKYQVSLYVVKDEKRGNMLGSTAVRVEEFLPDRMTISSKFNRESPKGWFHPDDLKAQVTLRTLFGTPAANRRVSARVTLTPAFLAFKEYPYFSFADPLRAKASFDEKLEPQQTSADGFTEFGLNLERYAKASYHLNVFTQGYEAEGGRFVATQVSSIVSPLEYLVGIHRHGDLNYLLKDKEHAVEIIAVNPNLEKVAAPELHTKLVELRWLSVLTKQANGTYAYQSVLKEMPISESALVVPKEGLSYQLKTSDPGNYALIVRDGDSFELNRVTYTVAGNADIPKKLEGNAELEIQLNKAEYLPGETIELQIKAPYTGAGLITIEKERVYNFVWFQTKTTSSVQHIQVPKELEGNGYVNVSFVRALDSKEIFFSSLSYGVSPFSISKKPRINPLTITAPELIKPGETLHIHYRAERPARAAIFLVDEGILQVAKYQTPDPLQHFYQKRALEVDTFQILDLLLPEYSIQQALSAAGGDMDALAKHLNPFKRKRAKPVLFWSGLLEVVPEEKELTYDVPDYFNGTIRVMAVAVAESAIGVTEKKTTVRGDFVITPNVPSAVSPGDVFEVSTAVLNDLANSGKNAEMMVKLSVDDALEIMGDAEVKMTISQGEEAVTRFTLKAKEKLGSAVMKFEARIGEKKATLAYDTAIRPASPLRTSLQAGASKGGKEEVTLKRRDVYPYGESYEASVSALPFGFARGLIRYLQTYPYGCTEQLMSRAMPALVIKTHPEFGRIKTDVIEANLRFAMRSLRSRQNTDGSISLWYPGGEVSNEIDTYAALFLIEAKERDYPVPPDLLNDLLRYLRVIANKTPESFHEARNGAYATYLLTKSGVVTTQYLTALRGWFDNYEQRRPEMRIGVPFESWKKDIAAVFLAATYKLLKEESEAQALFQQASFIEAVVPDYVYYYDRYVHGALYLYLTSKHFPSALKAISPQTLLNYLEPMINNGSYSTLSSSYALLALDAYVDTVAKGGIGKFKVMQVKGDGSEEAMPLAENELYPSFELAKVVTKLKLQSETFLFYQIYQEGYDRAVPTEPVKSGLEIYREFRDENDNSVSATRLGEKLTVILRARSLGKDSVSNAVIVDMLPGGFEVEMNANRFRGTGNTDTTSGTASQPIWGFGIAGSTLLPDYADVREDRVLLFGKIPSDKSAEFRYHLNPTNKGTFVVPPVYAESMYDRSVQAIFPGGTMTVQEAKPVAR